MLRWEFWKLINQKASDCGIDEPVLPRQRKWPRRYEDRASEADFSDSVEHLDGRTYYEALDLVTSGIKERFDQPGYKLYSNVEALLVKAAKKEKYDEEFQFVTDFYKDDFDHDQLNMQLGVLSSNIPCESAQDLKSVIKNFLRLRDHCCQKCASLLHWYSLCQQPMQWVLCKIWSHIWGLPWPRQGWTICLFCMFTKIVQINCVWLRLETNLWKAPVTMKLSLGPLCQLIELVLASFSASQCCTVCCIPYFKIFAYCITSFFG